MPPRMALERCVLVLAVPTACGSGDAPAGGSGRRHPVRLLRLPGEPDPGRGVRRGCGAPACRSRSSTGSVSVRSWRRRWSRASSTWWSSTSAPPWCTPSPRARSFRWRPRRCGNCSRRPWPTGVSTSWTRRARRIRTGSRSPRPSRRSTGQGNCRTWRPWPRISPSVAPPSARTGRCACPAYGRSTAWSSVTSGPWTRAATVEALIAGQIDVGLLETTDARLEIAPVTPWSTTWVCSRTRTSSPWSGRKSSSDGARS